MTAFLALLLWTAQATTGGIIEGSVIRAGTNPPLPLIHARVELSGGPQALVTRTNEAGKFSFSGLTGGAYGLSVTRDGYVRQPADSGTGAMFRITQGERIDNILFELHPAPTISGTIQDTANNPLADIVVQALKMSYDSVGGRHLTVFASTHTDDRGQYRLFWLDPGEYFVQALPPPPGESGKKVAFAATYFPGFADMDSARTVRLDAARETSGIDFAMTRQPITSVSGRVIHALTHDPVAARVRLTPATTPGFHVYESTGDQDGTFFFSGVAPGAYVVSSASATGTPLTATMLVQVRDFDPRITLEVGPGITLEGRMFADPGSAINARDLVVTLLPLPHFLPPVPAQADAEGRLVWNGIHPGRYVIDVAGLPLNRYLGDARFGAEDPMNKPLEVAYTETALPPLQMLLAADGGSLTGSVFNNEDKPHKGALITLVPAENPGYQVHRYRVTASDANGNFLVQGIAPGDYDLYAWEAIEPRAWLNMDFLRLYEHLSLRVQIKSGENGAASIQVIQP